jgi:hypothetical protein
MFRKLYFSPPSHVVLCLIYQLLLLCVMMFVVVLYYITWVRTHLRQQIAYSQNATKLVQNTADDHKCAPVCD